MCGCGTYGRGLVVDWGILRVFSNLILRVQVAAPSPEPQPRSLNVGGEIQMTPNRIYPQAVLAV